MARGVSGVPDVSDVLLGPESGRPNIDELPADIPVVPPQLPPTELNQIGQILTWIGFENPEHRTAILEDAFDCYEDINSLCTKDITDMPDSFLRRTAANGRIVFGTQKNKRCSA